MKLLRQPLRRAVQPQMVRRKMVQHVTQLAVDVALDCLLAVIGRLTSAEKSVMKQRMPDERAELRPLLQETHDAQQVKERRGRQEHLVVRPQLRQGRQLRTCLRE